MPGKLTNLPVMVERSGLGDTGLDWQDLRMFADGAEVYLEPDHSRAIVPFKVPWDRQFALVAQLLGYPYIDAEGFKRNIPESFRNWEWKFATTGVPNPPATPVMHCTRVAVKGVGDGAQDEEVFGIDYYPQPTYEWAKVTAFFETLIYDIKLLSDIAVDDDNTPREMQRYVIRTEDSGGKYLTYNYGQWVLIDGLGSVSQPLARQLLFYEAFQTVRYEWLDVLPGAFNHDRNQQLCGQTNATLFDNKQPETLLLLKANRYPTTTQLGIRTYRVVFDFAYVPTGVNKSRHPDPTKVPPYWLIRDAQTKTKKPIAAANMADLFRP